MRGEKQQLVDFLSRLQAAFAKQNVFALRELGNNAIEQAAMQNSKRVAGIALVAYCLHKMHSKQHIVRHRKWPVIRKAIGKNLEKALAALHKDNVPSFERNLRNIIQSIQSTDKQMGNYAQGLFEKAKVKYASTAYSLGLGLGQSASLTGANKKELLRYIGATKMADREVVTFGIKERLRKLKGTLRGA